MSGHSVETARARVFEVLRDLILSTELAPGAELREPELMARFEVGRTPLRDALLQLSNEGLVEIIPRKGTRVTPVAMTDLPLVFEAREGIEALVASAAIRRARDKHLSQLDAVLRDLETHRGEAEQRRLDMVFHGIMLASAGNHYLTSVYQRLSTDSIRLYHLSRCGMESAEEQVHFVRSVRVALADRDSVALQTQLIAHVRAFQSRLVAALVH